MEKNLKSDVIISYISVLVSILVTFFVTKVQVKYLGENMYGILGLVNSTVGYISIMELGVGQTVIKYLAQYKNEGDQDAISRLVGHSLKTYFKIVIIGLILGIIIIFNTNSIFNSLSGENIGIFNICFAIALINVLLQIPATTFYSVLSAYNDFRFFKIITIVRAVLKLILISILLVLGFGIISIFVIIFILTQISSLIIYIYCVKKYKVKASFKKIDEMIKRELRDYSFYVFLFLITDQIFWKTDSILLGIISSTSIVAIYSISSQIVMQFRQLSATFSSVFLTRIVDKINNNNSINEINKFYIKASKYQYIIIALITVSYISLGKEFLVLWVGEGFLDSFYFSVLIIIATLIPMSQTTLVQILYALNKHKARSIIYLVCAILNIILSVILYNVIGPMGVALATAIAMVICDNIFINIYYYRITGFRFVKLVRYAFMKTTIVVLITGGAYWYLNRLLNSNNWITLISKGIIGSLIYLILVYFISLDIKEKEFVKNSVLKYIKKFNIF